MNRNRLVCCLEHVIKSKFMIIDIICNIKSNVDIYITPTTSI